jgi:hypothetical protein
MKIFYAFFLMLQLFLASLARDKNRFAYLRYLWTSHIMGAVALSGSAHENSGADFNCRETKPEGTNSEYTLLLEQ